MTVVHESEDFEVWFQCLDRRDREAVEPLRVLYAFDPRREAWILLGGNKAKESNFYRRAIPRAEAIWMAHLGKLTREGQK